MKSRIYILLLLMITMASCVKKEDKAAPLSPMVNYTFENRTKKPIIIRVADSMTGDPFYMNIDPGVRQPIPSSRLGDTKNVKGLCYYWATTDFSMSSWYTASISEQIKNTAFGYQNGRYEYNIPIEPVKESLRMKYCLHGIEGTTTWTAIDAYDATGKSIWNMLPNKDKNHVIRLDNLQAATHDRSSSTGANIKDYMYYAFNNTGKDMWLDSYGYTSVDTGTSKDYQVSMANDLTGLAPLVSNSTDTLYMFIKGHAVYYKMVK